MKDEKSYSICAISHDILGTIEFCTRVWQCYCCGASVGWKVFEFGPRLVCCGEIHIGGSTSVAAAGKLSRRAGGTWVPASTVLLGNW